MTKFLTLFRYQKYVLLQLQKKTDWEKKCLYTKIEPKTLQYSKNKKMRKKKKPSDCVHGLDWKRIVVVGWSQARGYTTAIKVIIAILNL